MKLLRTLSLGHRLAAPGLVGAFLLGASNLAAQTPILFNTSDGNASTQNFASFGLTPSSGANENVLTTINPMASLPTTGPFNAGNPNLGSTPADAVGGLNAFFGLPANTLSGLGAQDGSGYLSQSVVLTIGTVVSFDYVFLTDEDNTLTGTQYHNDFAFLTVNGTLNRTLINASALNTNDSASASGTIFTFQSAGAAGNGFTRGTFTVPSTGSYTFGFGVADVGTNTIKSGLAIDNFTFSVIPEPGTATALLVLGGAAVAGAARKRLRGRPSV